GHDPVQKAEVRRLTCWFDIKFNQEVTENLVGEKLMKRFLKMGEPHGPSIRAGHANIHYHMDYIGFLTEKRNWLAGDQFSLADIAAAAHLSAIDYIGDVPWDEHQAAKDWYARVKSRPSFQGLLEDRIPGFLPARHYENVDF
ncbi:MAG: glutathione S-transferase family protein, partial [Pseudomonadota bacterium]|nr:glutathione S-transferase family protein [Pseudomonadota bacterium]